MRKTTNYGLVLYDAEDKMNITSSENSLNATMEIIDSILKDKATIEDMTEYIEEHKDELKGSDGIDGKDYILTESDKEDISKLVEVNIPTKVSELENDKSYLSSVPLEYVTEEELTEKGYATENFVSNKIAEAELSGSDVDLSGYATKDEVNAKVDKVKGKSLIDDTEISRLANVTNYDDTEIKSSINSKADKTDIPSKVSELENDKNYLTSIPNEYITETELNNKGYLTEHQDISNLATKDELNNKANVSHTHSEYLTSIPNEYITETELNAKNYLSSVPSDYKTKTENDSLYQPKGSYLTSYTESDPTVPSHVKNIKETDISNWNNKSEFSGSYNDLTNKPTIPTVPSDISAFNNDKGYLTSVPSEYITETELNNVVSNKADKASIPTKTSELTNDSGYLTEVELTPEQLDEIAQTVVEAQTIEFVVEDTMEEALAWLEANGDKSKVYALPNGYVYKWMTREVTYDKPNCNNLFVADEAWLGYRISSANLVKAYTGRTLTNVIPVNPGETYDIRVYGLGGCEQIVEFSDVPTLVEEQVPTNFVQKTAGLSKTWEEPNTSTCKFTHTMSSTTKYILLDTFATTEDELANGIVTLNESVVLGTTPTTEEVTEWTNTGQTYNSTDYEDRIIALEEDSIKYDSRLTALESDTSYIPDYWQTHLDEKIPLIRETMANVGKNKSAFLFYSDAHWNGNTGNSPMLLKYLYKYTSINKINYGGDIVSTESATFSDMAYLYDSWRSAIRDLPNHHSVAGNHDDRNESGYDHGFSKSYVYSYLLAPEETNDRVDGAELFYYIDDKCENTRYLYLDTACYDANALSLEQAQFIVDSLKSTPDNYHIVVIGHAWFKQNYDNYPTVTADGLTTTTSKLMELFKAYNSTETSERTGTLSELTYVVIVDGEEVTKYDGSVNYDFTNAGGRVEFCIGGHLHNDYNETFNGIPVILCEADTMHNRNGSVSTAGTISEQCITAVIADYANSKIHLIRIGRGSDREISY